MQNFDPRLYNKDLAPIPTEKRNWGWFEIFNVWSNDVQSLFGYSLAASLFLTYGLNGWAVSDAIVLSGIIVMYLVNLSGRPSVKHGIYGPNSGVVTTEEIHVISRDGRTNHVRDMQMT